MASQHSGPSVLAPQDAREASVTTDATLDVPYSSDEEHDHDAHDIPCRWRTSQFHDQECYRYFDCPSHVVERRLSVDDTGEASFARESNVEATPVRDDSVSPRTSVDEHTESDQDHTTTEAQPRDDALVAAPSEPLSGLSSELATARERDGATTTAPADATTLPARTSSLPIRTRVPSRSIDLRTTDQSGNNLWGESSDHASRGYTASASATDLSGSSSPRMSARDQLSAMYAVDTDRIAGESGLHQSLVRPPERDRRESTVVLPRWQPDAEVTYCPICRTQFSIFVRKHHCRYACP